MFTKGNNMFPCIRESRFLVLDFFFVRGRVGRREESGKLQGMYSWRKIGESWGYKVQHRENSQ